MDNAEDYAIEYRNIYKPIGYFTVRMPILPIEYCLSFEDDNLEAKVLDNKIMIDALMVTSTELLERIKTTKGDAYNNSKLHSKLLRYIIRASSRPTPYGVFAGVALGKFEKHANLDFDDLKPHIKSRPDMGWFVPLISKLEHNKKVLMRLNVMVNQSLSEHGGRIFAVEDLSLAELNISKQISVKASNASKMILSATDSGVKYTKLVKDIAGCYDVEKERVENTVLDLVDKGILTTDLRPSPTEMNPLGHIISRLDGTQDEAVKWLRLLHSSIGRLNKREPGHIGKEYENAMMIATKLAGTNKGPYLQVDMGYEIEDASLPYVVGLEAAKAAELILNLTLYPKSPPYIERYKTKFAEKYNEFHEVPLLEMIDPDLGIGLPYEDDDVEAQKNTERDRTLLNMVSDALAYHKRAIKIDNKVIQKLITWKSNVEDAPTSIDLFVEVYAESRKALNEGDFRLGVSQAVGSVGAGSGSNRFSHLLGKEWEVVLGKIAKEEENANRGKVVAEIITFPKNPSTTNIEIRKQIYKYEIPLGTVLSSRQHRMIPLKELVVGLKSNRFYIKWKTKGKEVVVRTSSMMNQTLLPDTLRLLVDLSSDGLATLRQFDFGTAESLPFLPRIEAGRIVLRFAEWKLSRYDIGDENLGNAKNFFMAFDKWAGKWSISEFVYLKMYDNKLLLNRKNAAHVEQIRLELRRSNVMPVILQEAMIKYGAMAKVKNKHHVTEFVVPLAINKSPNHRKRLNSESKSIEVKDSLRLKAPSSDWIYVKFYINRGLEEDIIARQLLKFSHQVIKAGIADSWFFVRFADPYRHIRVRFNGYSEQLTKELLPKISIFGGKLMKENMCSKFIFDTYDREIERYGGPIGIELAERLFYVDSEISANLLSLLMEGKLAIDKQILTALTTDYMMESLGLSKNERLRIYSDSVKHVEYTPYEDFNYKRKNLVSLFEGTKVKGEDTDDKVLKELRDSMKVKLNDIGIQLKNLESKKQLSNEIDYIYNSYIHMHCIRMFGLNRSEENSVRILLKRALETLLFRKG